MYIAKCTNFHNLTNPILIASWHHSSSFRDHGTLPVSRFGDALNEALWEDGVHIQSMLEQYWNPGLFRP